MVSAVDMVVAATEAGTVAGVAWAGNHKVLAVVAATEQDTAIVVVATVADSVGPVGSSPYPQEVGAVVVADTMCLAVAIVVVEAIPILDVDDTRLVVALVDSS